MAIVTLSKLTLCGLNREKTEVLRQLQDLGGAHLIPLTELPMSAESASHQITEKAISALKYLMQCQHKRHQVKNTGDFNLHEVVEKTLTVRSECRRLSDQRDFLLKRIEEIEPWGDFKLTDEDDVGSIKLWFYIVPKRLMNKLGEELIYEVVHRDNIYCYVVVLAEKEPAPNVMPVTRTHTGKVPLSQLRKQLEETLLQLEDLQAERQSLTRWVTLISLSLVKNEEEADLKVAHTLTLDNDVVFVVQAWIPETDKERFLKYAEEHRLAALIAEPEASEVPPTLLSNRENLAGGEDVIGFYQTPAYFDWDPSLLVFFSFALFFAMILSDAGYAGVFGLILAIKWRSWGKAKKGRRLRMLAAVTIGFSLLWGMLTGSYFGYTPPQGTTVLASFKILDLNDFDAMMRLSVAVGTSHIAIANLIRAYRKRHGLSGLAPLGWVLAVCGGFLFWVMQEQSDRLTLLAEIMIAIGLALLLLFNSEQPLNKPSDLLRRLLDGIKSLTGVTQLFGDVLSYMRLFALGLASASLALTFNQLAVQVYHSVSGVGLLFGILILLLGHSLNLVLCLMSGVVHGLRLNFIEFYNWGVSDEGYPFKAFAKKGGGS